MKFWTIQTKNVIESIQKNGVYQPDFRRSRYLLRINRNLIDLYAYLLRSFNRVNHRNLPGVVFAFAKGGQNGITSIGTMDEFRAFIQSKQDVIGGFWKELDRSNSVIMELDYEDNFNPLWIDINDFQFIMPPITLLPSYTEESFLRILANMAQGRFEASPFPSNVIQGHLPSIEKRNVINVYPLFG